MNDHAGLVRIARFRPGAGRRDEVAALLKLMAETARDAKGCFGAQVTSSDRDPDAVVLVSRWESREALDRFGESPEFAGVRRQIEPALSGQPEFELFTTA